MNKNQLNQERQQSEQDAIVTSPINRSKIQLIDHNVRALKALLRTSLFFSLLRLIVFIAIIKYPEVFISIDTANNNNIDTTCFIFFIMTSFIDILSIMNDVQILKFMTKEVPKIRQIKEKLRSNSTIIPITFLGRYQIYLSLYDLIKSCKGSSRATGSIHDTIKVLHIFISFYGVGNFALHAQPQTQTTVFKYFALWIYILSIYYSHFEIDLVSLETSSGKFIEQADISNTSEDLQKKKDREWRHLIQVFIKRVRRFYEIMYVVIIVCLLIMLALYFDYDLFSLMTVLCIVSHMAELIHEKYIQNKLISIENAYLPHIFITPYRLLSQMTKQHPTIFRWIVSCNRIVIVMLIMSYFQSQSESTPYTLMFLVINGLVFGGQYVKFKKNSQSKLYLINSYKNEGLVENSLVCSICLVNCTKRDDTIELPCFSNHIFHQGCLKSWLRQRKECPLCRYSLEYYEIQ